MENFTETQKGYNSQAEKNFAIFRKATGLNVDDIETAVTQPRKIQYISDTLREMESGKLKIRVRSLENEKALERMNLRQSVMENVVFASLFFNIANLSSRALVTYPSVAGGAFFLFQTLMASTKIKKFDKTQAKYVAQDDFTNASDESDSAWIAIHRAETFTICIHIEQHLAYVIKCYYFWHLYRLFWNDNDGIL